ncbi:MAG TPA: hypothetical protein VGB95_01530, partial [Chitinophagales bacterium]
MNVPKKLDEKEILHYAKKYEVSVADNYELDTTYFSFLFSHDTAVYKYQIKNHYQPMQALYYDKSEQLQSFQINCYAGGFPNLNWNRNGIFQVFPPKNQAPIDSLVPLSEQLKHLHKLSSSTEISVNNYDYIVLVFWNRFGGRQSKRLIHFVQDNAKLTDKKVKIIY